MRTPTLIGRRTIKGISDVLVISTMAFCNRCCANRLFVNLQRWDMVRGVHGCCSACKNGQLVRVAGSPSLPGNDAA